MICRHCKRTIVNEGSGLYVWIDPEATGGDSIWRETCDSNDTFTAEHEPESKIRHKLQWQRSLEQMIHYAATLRDPEGYTAILIAEAFQADLEAVQAEINNRKRTEERTR